MRAWVIAGSVLVAACASSSSDSDSDEQPATTHACLTFNSLGKLVSCLELNFETVCGQAQPASGAFETTFTHQQKKCPRGDPAVPGFCEQPLSDAMVARSFSYDDSDAGVDESRRSCEEASFHWIEGSGDE